MLHTWASDLFPINRSLTGNGVRETLGYIRDLIPNLQIHEVPSGTKVMDWAVPDEWNITEGYIETLHGHRIVDFAECNLHVVGYSTPLDRIISWEDLKSHLYTLPTQPDAIPYVTSYYARNWGFCLRERDMTRFKDNEYHVVIKSSLAPGSLTYAELIIPGSTSDEILLSTYMCHPSMANNELSGPVVMTALARWLMNQTQCKYTYRILFLPETIGSITYLARHIDDLRSKVKAGWVLTCMGDDLSYSYVPSRLGNTLADRISLAVLSGRGKPFRTYSYLDRGSDERQWCAPGVDLPVASIMRSKYGEFPEYHTSLDDLNFITPEGLQGGLDIMVDAITVAETNGKWRVKTLGEPQLGKRGLYPNVSIKESTALVRNMMNVIAYSDGEHDSIEISKKIGVAIAGVTEIIQKLFEASLLEKIE